MIGPRLCRPVVRNFTGFDEDDKIHSLARRRTVPLQRRMQWCTYKSSPSRGRNNDRVQTFLGNERTASKALHGHHPRVGGSTSSGRSNIIYGRREVKVHAGRQTIRNDGQRREKPTRHPDYFEFSTRSRRRGSAAPNPMRETTRVP